MNDFKHITNLFKLLGIVVGVALVVLGISGLIMLMWNWLAPVFNLPTLNIWQALVLNILCNILFKNVSDVHSK